MERSCPVRKALLLSEAEPAAVPRKRMEPAVFIADLKYRLGWLKLYSTDAVLDTFSLHAGVCTAGSERNQRHHALRDVVCTWADRAGLQPVAATTGAWDPAAAKVLQIIARAVAAREQVEAAAFFSEMLQETSVLIRSFRGRAALQRRADTALAEAPSHAASAAAVVLQS